MTKHEAQQLYAALKRGEITLKGGDSWGSVKDGKIHKL